MVLKKKANIKINKLFHATLGVSPPSSHKIIFLYCVKKDTRLIYAYIAIRR